LNGAKPSAGSSHRQKGAPPGAPFFFSAPENFLAPPGSPPHQTAVCQLWIAGREARTTRGVTSETLAPQP